MRALILTVLATLSLAACNKSGPVDNAANAADGLSAESITSNDITAIDAVTGADANMAMNAADTANAAADTANAAADTANAAANNAQ